MKSRNLFGRKGGPAHQAEIAKIKQDIRARGLEPLEEFTVKTPSGVKSYRGVDVAARDPRTGWIVELHQVGRKTKRGIPVRREIQAMKDIEAAINLQVQFHPYH